MSSGKYLFTSESVSMGHPDKLADQISDAILDAMLAADPHSRVACETMVSTELAVVAGGFFSSAVVVIAFTANKELFPVQMAGTATGIVNLFPFAGGAVFQPLLGYVLEQHGRAGAGFTLMGYRSAFLLLFVSGLIAFLFSLFIKETLQAN